MPLIPECYTPDTIVIGIIGACRRLGVDDLATVCAIACAKVESNLKMYANKDDPRTLDYPFQALSSDKNSAGIYQQRFPWWDDPETDDSGGSSDRMDVFRSTKLFVTSLLRQKPNYHDNPGEAIANTQNCRADLRWKYGANLEYAWAAFNRLKNEPIAPTPGTVPPAALEPFASKKPAYTEIEFFGWGATSRSRPAINFFLHTEEGDSSARNLAAFCQGQNNVSYHYVCRDAILYDVVDTDLYSWSVLNANVFSINFCFAGSRAGWSREEWLARERDIEIAAWIAVQDCRKYPTMSTLVIPPPYDYQGPGISDHKYVTQKLGIGTHHDVGENFPWDRFEFYVLQFNGNTNSGDILTKEEHDALMQVWGSLFNPVNSESVYARPGEQIPTKDMLRYTDGSVHSLAVEHAAIILGDPKQVQVVKNAMDRGSERAELAWRRIPDKFKALSV